MNELLFLFQIIVIFGFSLGAVKLGKEALTSWVAILAIVANLFVIKQITLFSFHVTPSDAYMIGSLLGLNFLQEFYDKSSAQKATWICFFFMIFFAIISQFQIYYLPSPYDTTQSAFEKILSPSFRLMIASLTVFFIVQQIDIRLFAFLKNRLPNSSLALRTTITLILSQLLDTTLFSFAGLYGLVSSMFDVIAISFSIKLITILFSSSFVRWAKV